MLEATKKQRVIYKGTSTKVSAIFFFNRNFARREWHEIFKVLKVKPYNLGYSTQQS